MHELKRFFIRLVAAAFLIAFGMITSRTPDTQNPAQTSARTDVATPQSSHLDAADVRGPSPSAELTSVQTLPSTSPRME